MKHFIRALIFLSLSLPQISKAQNLQISGGNNFSAAVCDNQVVFVWGANTSDQLGIIDVAGTPNPNTYSSLPVSVTFGNISNTAGGSSIGALPAIKQIDAGSGAFIMGLSCAKQVWSWGDNSFGQLGRGAGAPAKSPVPQRVLRGAQASKIDIQNDPNGIFLHDIDYVSGGNNCSFAIEAGTGRVLAWGENTYGQLGDGTIINRTTPVYVKTGPGATDFLENIVQIEGGDACAFALDKSGKVWSWGITHDDAWPSYALGRPFTGEIIAAPGGAHRCIPYAGKVQKTTPNGGTLSNGACNNPVDLDGIQQLSGGDTHALGLATDGRVWSWGGDWGTGQLGQGNGGQYKACAGLVVDVNGTYNTIDATNKALGEGVDGKAVYIAAGQAVSAVVLASGKVVTFGANGLFEGGNLALQSGSIACGGRLSSGALGLGPGSGSCNAMACQSSSNIPQDENDPTKSYEYPKYVLTSAGTPLTGMTQVSDGDAWFYAIGATGNAYTWGFNRRGELGLGTPSTPNDYTDRCYAVPFALPSSCAFTDPCAGQPDLRASFLTCPIFSEKLNTQVKPTVSTWRYTWYSRPIGSTDWGLPISGPILLGDTLTVDKLREYKVEISDTRANVPFLCAPCPVLKDSLTINEITNPYTSTGCKDDVHRAAFFQITNQPDSKFEWYSKPVGGTPLPNPVDSTHSIGVYFEDTDSTSKINGCERGLWAVDTTSYPAVLRPNRPCAGTKQQATGYPYKIQVLKKLTVNEISFFQAADGTNSNSYTVQIVNHNPTGGWNCGTCTPPNSNSGSPGATILGTATIGPLVSNTEIMRTVPMNVTLDPGTYWIQMTGGPVTYFDCPSFTTNTTATPIWNNIEVSKSSTNTAINKSGMNGIFALAYGNNQGGGNVFNIKFDVGTGYNCDRIWVCAENICILPVQYLYFTGKKDNDIVELNWATASEKDASHFDIERSADGVNFEKIGSVSASGNSNRVIDYSFVDIHSLAGNAYYRLKQVDYNGQSEYSKIININSVKNTQEVHVIPNPNNGSFNVVVTGAPKETYEISVLNALGQPIYSTSGKSESTNITQAVNIQNLASGVYYVRVTTGESSTVTQIIKE